MTWETDRGGGDLCFKFDPYLDPRGKSPFGNLTLAGNPIALQEIPEKSFCFWPSVASYPVHTEKYQGTEKKLRNIA